MPLPAELFDKGAAYPRSAQYNRPRKKQFPISNNIAETGTGTGAVYTENCTSRKFFNNEDQGGTLLRGYNGSQKALELQDAVDDVLLPL